VAAPLHLQPELDQAARSVQQPLGARKPNSPQREAAEAVTANTGARAQVRASLLTPTADTAFAWPPEISGETAGKISQ
jgi:hypothetical protein